jgi:hypothetical protein
MENISIEDALIEAILIWARNQSISSRYAYRRCPVCQRTWFPDELERHEWGCWVRRLQGQSGLKAPAVE